MKCLGDLNSLQTVEQTIPAFYYRDQAWWARPVDMSRCGNDPKLKDLQALVLHEGGHAGVGLVNWCMTAGSTGSRQHPVENRDCRRIVRMPYFLI